jgi:hypothetical protein
VARQVGQAVAKRAGYTFYVGHPALQCIEGYRLSSRAQAVRRAQARTQRRDGPRQPPLAAALKNSSQNDLGSRCCCSPVSTTSGCRRGTPPTSGAREDDELLGRSGHRDIAVYRSFDALAERLWVDEDDQVELEPLR